MRRRNLLKNNTGENKYLTFRVKGGSLLFNMVNRNSAVEYSTDGGLTWTSMSSSSTTYTPTITAGQTVIWRGNLTPRSSSGIGRFATSGTGTFDVEGNPMSLLYGDNFSSQTDLSGKAYAFSNLFAGCTNLVSAENLVLPATTLANYCYTQMFSQCTSLTTIQTNLLPTTTLADYCYTQMFYGCTGLTAAPSLPATTLADYCYGAMFEDCYNLTTAPELPATTLAGGCYNAMFYNTNVLPDCTNIDFSSQTVVQSGGLIGLFTGTKITDSQLNTILRSHGIYNYSLPVTTLAYYCYQHMFADCTNLTTAPSLPATTLAGGCYASMFNGCTSLTAAPSLPATTLADECYQFMFYDCSQLSSITCYATDISAYNCTWYWVSGVASSGTFVKASSMSSWTTGIDGIPSGWTVRNA